MAQQIISMAKEETSQDILTRVRGLETNIEEVDGNIGEVAASVGSAWVPRLKEVRIDGAGTMTLEIPYSEAGYEIYNLNGGVGNATNYTTIINNLTIDGKTIANLRAKTGYVGSGNGASVSIEMRNLSYMPFPGSNFIVTESNIGDETTVTTSSYKFYLPFFGRFFFHSLLWEASHAVANAATLQVRYLEKVE